MNYVTINPFKKILLKTAPFVQLPYEVQLQFKDARVNSLLKSLLSLFIQNNTIPDQMRLQIQDNNGLICLPNSIIPSPVINGYRNKTSAMIGLDIYGTPSVGNAYSVIRNSKKKIVTIPYLPKELNNEENLEAIKITQEFVRNSEFQPKSFYRPWDCWSSVALRSNRKEHLCFHINFNGYKSSECTINKAREELMNGLIPQLQSALTVKSVFWQWTHFDMTSDENAYPSKHLWGDKYITEHLAGRTFQLHPRSFFQINTEAAELLFKNVRENIQRITESRVNKTLLLDLCCGTGTHGIILSDLVDNVIGVDQSLSAIENAKSNAHINDVNNAEFYAGNADDFIENIVSRFDLKQYDQIIAIVNPGRLGISSNMCRNLRKLPQLTNIIYISCKFEGNGDSNIYRLCCQSKSYDELQPFTISKVVPFDFFPFTNEVELVLYLNRT